MRFAYYLLHHVLACFLATFFLACTFMLSSLLQHSAKIVSEVCLMEAHSVQQSAAETDTLKFCLLHREL